MPKNETGIGSEARHAGEPPAAGGDRDRIAVAKATVRGVLRRQLALITPDERRAAGALARRLLERQPVWARAGAVLFYAPMPDEVDLWPLLEQAVAAGREVGLPRYVASRDEYEAARIGDVSADVVVGHWGIREPGPKCVAIPLNRLDLALVPGVGFDCRGRRLGRGRGFYDRLLSTVVGVRCGVALDTQVLPEIPHEPHDQLLDCILTPTRWVACSRRAV